MRSKKLSRQLKKVFSSEELEALALKTVDQHAQSAASPEEKEALEAFKELPSFFEGVDEAYAQAEKMLAMATKNLELSSQELVEANKSLFQLNGYFDVMINSLGQGFLLFGADGLCLPTYSKRCEDLLEAVPVNKHISDVLKVTEAERENFSFWLNLLFSDTMDFDDLALIGPKKFKHAEGKEIWLEYKAVRSKDKKITFVLLIATDRTAEIRAIREAEQLRSYADMIVKMVKGREEFFRFLEDAKGFIQKIDTVCSKATFDEEALKELKFHVHTLKGAAGVFSVDSVKTACHELEQKVHEESDLKKISQMGKEIVTFSRAEVAKVEAQCVEIVGRDAVGAVSVREVPTKRLFHFAEKLEKSGGASPVLQEFIHDIVAEPVSKVLGSFDKVVSHAAQKLGKKMQSLEFSGENPVIVRECYDSVFSTLGHLFTNSVAHGIETEAERVRLGKAPAGKILVTSEKVVRGKSSWLSIEIRDDGSGIALDKVRDRLRSKGIDPAGMSEADLLQVVFEPGFSTAEQVNDIAGRGVGLSAVKSAVKDLGGTISIYSVSGGGCTFLIELPYFEALPGWVSEKMSAAA